MTPQADTKPDARNLSTRTLGDLHHREQRRFLDCHGVEQPLLQVLEHRGQPSGNAGAVCVDALGFVRQPNQSWKLRAMRVVEARDDIAGQLRRIIGMNRRNGRIERVQPAADGGRIEPKPPEGACNTWRALCLGLGRFADDLIEHAHTGNDVLFKRCEAAAPAGATSPGAAGGSDFARASHE